MHITKITSVLLLALCSCSSVVIWDVGGDSATTNDVEGSSSAGESISSSGEASTSGNVSTSGDSSDGSGSAAMSGTGETTTESSSESTVGNETCSGAVVDADGFWRSTCFGIDDVHTCEDWCVYCGFGSCVAVETGFSDACAVPDGSDATLCNIDPWVSIGADTTVRCVCS